MTFESLGLSATVLKAVAKKGYTTPSPIQQKAIRPVLSGKDGFEEVVELDLSNKELEMFKNSVKAVKETNSSLIGLI